MTDHDKGGDAADPVIRALRDAAGDPRPSAAERQRAEGALQRALAGAPSRRTRRWSGRKSWRFVVAIAASSVVALGLAVQQLRPTAASAALSEIAAAAERVDPLDIPAQAFAYTLSETTVLAVQPPDAFGEVVVPATGIAYLLPQTRESWIGTDRVVQLRITTGQPTFFTPESEAAYYSAGLDRSDKVAQTVTSTVSGTPSLLESRLWPTNPDQLLETFRSLVPPDRGLPDTVEIFDLALDLLRETGAPPELRAAVVRVLSTLDLEILERRPDGANVRKHLRVPPAH